MDDAKVNDLDKILGTVEAEVKAITSVQNPKRSNKKKTPADSQPSAPASG